MTKDLLYCNTDKWIEKLSAILWGIPDDKWTDHKFDTGSRVDKVAEQSLTIQSRNVIDCLKFFIRHTGFWEN